MAGFDPDMVKQATETTNAMTSMLPNAPGWIAAAMSSVASFAAAIFTFRRMERSGFEERIRARDEQLTALWTRMNQQAERLAEFQIECARRYVDHEAIHAIVERSVRPLKETMAEVKADVKEARDIAKRNQHYLRTGE